MNLFFLNLLLALIWGALMGSFEPGNLLFGFLLGFIILAISERSFSQGRSHYFRKTRLAIQLILIFVYDIILANIRVLRAVLSKEMNLRPAVVAIPLRLQQDHAITLFSNIIALTPGTLSLDVSSDRKIIFVHVMIMDDEKKFRMDMQNGYERRIKELLEDD